MCIVQGVYEIAIVHIHVNSHIVLGFQWKCVPNFQSISLLIHAYFSLFLVHFAVIVWTQTTLFKQLVNQVLQYIAKTNTTNRFTFNKTCNHVTVSVWNKTYSVNQRFHKATSEKKKKNPHMSNATLGDYYGLTSAEKV